MSPDLHTADDEVQRRADRAADLLARRGAWLTAQGAAYAVRATDDRRRRPLMTVDEAVFRRLVRAPGLRPKPRGVPGEEGWIIAGRQDPSSPAPPAGRPSLIEGERLVAEPDGRLVKRRANLGESPLEWLARRKDGEGRPWLDAVELRAGEKLRDDFQLAGTVGRLTMAWDAGPRAKGGRGPGLEPVERARAAKARVHAALEAVGLDLRGIVQHVCFAGTALEAAERSLGLPKRTGKHALKTALGRLAEHYRMR